MAPAVRIQVCGRVALVLDGVRREPELPGRQGRDLFVLLVLRREEATSRDHLIESLWSSGAPAAADAALSALLSKLRRVVGPAGLGAGAEPRLVLGPDAFVDFEAASEAVHRAESAVASGRWTQAWGPARVALHTANRGLLQGRDGAWIEEARRMLEDIRLRALECVGAVGLALGGAEVASAERAGRALVASWPYHESGHRLLMEALAARDNVAEALLRYEDLRRLLRDELGIVPSAALQACHGELLAQRAR